MKCLFKNIKYFQTVHNAHIEFHVKTKGLSKNVKITTRKKLISQRERESEREMYLIISLYTWLVCKGRNSLFTRRCFKFSIHYNVFKTMIYKVHVHHDILYIRFLYYIYTHLSTMQIFKQLYISLFHV